MVHFQWWDSKVSELKFVCAGLYHSKQSVSLPNKNLLTKIRAQA